MLRTAVWSSALASLAIAGIGCASTSSDAPGSGADAGAAVSDQAQNAPADAGAKDASKAEAPDADDGLVAVSGKLLDGQNGAPVAASINWAGRIATTSPTGDYSVRVRPGVAATPTTAATGYVQMSFQEVIVTGPSYFGALALISTSASSLLQMIYLPGYSAQKGVLVVQLSALPSCASTAGATLSVSPAGSSKVVYFKGGLPDASLSGVLANEEPSALLYDVDPNVALALTVASPACAQAPYPVTESTVTYTGAMQVSPGDQITFARAFLR